MNIQIISESKGSNPGGVCRIPKEQKFDPAYFKFVYGSSLTHNSLLVTQHQPVYEALTFELARKFGLDTVDYAVLLNPHQDIVFENWKNHKFKHDPSGRVYYFVSQIFQIPDWARKNEENPASIDHIDNASDLISIQQLYLDTLLISDVVGKRQNYMVLNNWPLIGLKMVKYVDLGCSFVHAVEGFIKNNARVRNINHKEQKRIIHKLRGKKIMNYSGHLMDLEEIVESLSDIELNTLNPRGKLRLRELIEWDEVSEIRGYLLQGLSDSLSAFKAEGLLEEG